MEAGTAGTLLVTKIDLVTGLPQGLPTVTITLPDPKLLRNLTVILLVPCPFRILPVIGIFQLKDVAPGAVTL